MRPDLDHTDDGRRQRHGAEPRGSGWGDQHERVAMRARRRRCGSAWSRRTMSRRAMSRRATSRTMDSEDSADEAVLSRQRQQRQAQQARQTKAQEASERAAKFQAQQRDRVHAPAIADSGMQPWDGVSVEVAQLDESKVRDVHPPPRTTPAAHSPPPPPAAGARLWHDAQDQDPDCGPAPGRPSCCPPGTTRC